MAAGWLRPATWVESQVGRRRWVNVPLYRAHTVDALLDIDLVDWRAVRACQPRQPSPLRAFAARPRSRANVVHRFVAGLGDRYGVEAWAAYDRRRDRWRIGWDPLAGAERIEAVVRAALAEDPAIAPFVVVIDVGAVTVSGRRVDGPVNTRWTEGLVEDVGPEPGPTPTSCTGAASRAHRDWPSRRRTVPITAVSGDGRGQARPAARRPPPRQA